MKFLTTSEIYWAIWILLGFLVPELLAAFHVIPMLTLSRTSWDDEARFPVLRTVLLGFLTGLVFHIVFMTQLWITMACAMVFAFGARHFWRGRGKV